MIDERKGVGPDDRKFGRKDTAGLPAYPVHPAGDLPPYARFRDVPGVVPEAAAVEVAEDDLVRPDREQAEDLPGTPDQGAVKRRVEPGEQGIERGFS